jgi:DNA-binding winged helix-turn-helix (wHTH) protein
MTEDPDPVVILKLIGYYERQSCGHQGWETSEARKFCEDLRLACIRSLPGYDAAPWTIDNLQEASISSRPSDAEERSNDARREQEIIAWGPVVLTVQGRACVVAGQELHLTYMEYELLRFLATQPGKVFTRETLLNRVWGYEYYGGARTVDVHVRRLRAKFGEEYAHLIETVRSVGYRFGQSDDLGTRSGDLDLDAIA